MVIRKVLASLAAAGVVLGSTAAAAAPAAVDGARVESPVAASEDLGGSAWPWLLALLIVVGIVGVIAANNNDFEPTSP